MIKFDLKERLAKFDADRVSPNGECRYSAPCAVGVMLTKEEIDFIKQQKNRGTFSLPVDSTGFEKLTNQESEVFAHVFDTPKEQIDDIQRLQDAYDIYDDWRSVAEELKKKYVG